MSVILAQLLKPQNTEGYREDGKKPTSQKTCQNTIHQNLRANGLWVVKCLLERF
jgi:hypothetical protein